MRSPSATDPPEQRTLPSSPALFEIHNMLHLLYHRNKNQHRCAKWFKSLSMLRRATRDLAWEIEKVERSDHDDGDDVEEGDGGFMARKLMAHLGAEIIPRAYRAFSTVVADTQFSALGVVLIALLGRISTVIGATDYFPRDEERQQETEPRDAMMAATATDKAVHSSLNTEDLGEVVARHDHDAAAPAIVADDKVASAALGLGKTKDKTMTDKESARISESPAVSHEKSGGGGDEERREKPDKRKTKKKRKANAIDDIFGDL